MSWWLFLDDVRDPTTTVDSDSWRRRMGLPRIDYVQSRPAWVIARSFEEAVDLIREFGFPTMVSFDHDLGQEASGLTLARHLIELDMDHRSMPEDFRFEVHSANPVGRANIQALLSAYVDRRRTPGSGCSIHTV